MAVLSLSVVAALLISTFCCSTLVTASRSTHIQAERRPVNRHWANTGSKRRQHLDQGGGVSLDKNHETNLTLWFGNFTVGDGSGLQLLLDTGSTDLLVNPGEYKPSAQQKSFQGEKNFQITYEGVNAAGTGFETINGQVFLDKVSDGTLSTPEHAIGSIQNYTVVDAPPKATAIGGDGIIGLFNAMTSSFQPPTPSWIYNLCSIQALKECRFGFAFGTDKKGVTVLGKVDYGLFNGALTVAPLMPGYGYIILADIIFDKDLVFKNQTLIMDSGTSNIQAPLDAANKIFDKLGYGTVTTVGGPNPIYPGTNITFTMGFYPCHKPPTLDFSIPAAYQLANYPKGAQISKKAKKFRMFEDQWSVHNNGHNNCTSVVAGTNYLGNDTIWLIGQPFFEGHYVDHYLNQSMGFAKLKFPQNPDAHSGHA